MFSKGANSSAAELIGTEADVLGVDWRVDLTRWRRRLPKRFGIQGNLDPSLLIDSTPGEIELATKDLLTQMRGRDGYIFNLGHGIPPSAKLQNIERMVATIRSFV